MRILTVDDEPLILMDIEYRLQEAGHEVVAVHNAERAIAVLASRSIDLILTDIDMPGSMDGLMLAEAVRTRWPPVKIVVMSGKKRPRRDQLPSDARFVEKPFRSHSLMEAVGTW